MNKPISRIIEIYLPHFLLGLASFACFFFFFYYVFFFQEKERLFLTTAEYFFAHFNRPGGLLMYLSEFLTAFYYFPFAGAIILSTIIVLAAMLVQQIQKWYSAQYTVLLPFIAGGTLYYLQSDYHFLLFNSLGIVLQLMVFFLALRTDRFLKGWIPVFLFPFWYFITGSLAFIFALQFSLHLILKKEKLAAVQLAALWLLVLIFVYFSKEYLFYFSLKELLIYPFKASLGDFHYQIYFALGVFLILIPVISLIKRNSLHKDHFSGILFRLGFPILIIASALLFVSKHINPKDKYYFQVENLFYQGKYDEIVEYNLKYPSANYLTCFLINIAQSERGKLTEMLFQFPQSADSKTLFLPWDMAGEILKRGGYFYYSIGMINEAHRWAYENMVMNGYTPESVKMLIRTELIEGNLKMAEKYINLLDESLFYRKDAAVFRRIAEDNVFVDRDPDLGAKRRMKLNNDFFVLADEPMLNVEAVLKNNPENMKALDYKMAFLLLKKDFKGIVNTLPLYENAQMEYLPINIEEAVVAYKTLGMGDDVVIDKLNIRPETIDRFTSYLQIFKQFGNDKGAAQQALYKRFGNTFWYYVFYK